MIYEIINLDDIFEACDGFDVVIANPPYLGEKGHKDVFHKIVSNEFGRLFYAGKMDIFYFFVHLALDLTRKDGSIAYITTNYYLTASGAKKLRKDIHDRAIVKILINFNELKIFESANGQHNMVTVLTKGNDDNALARACITKRTGDANSSILKEIVSWQDDNTNYFEVAQKDLFDGDESYIRLAGNSVISGDPIQIILRKLKDNNELLGDLVNINSGADITISKITGRHIEIFNGNFRENDGVFVLSNDEIQSLHLDANEIKKAKQFIKNSDIYSFGVKFTDDKLLYLRWEDNINKYPNIKKHLSRFKEILEDQQNRYGESYPWFALHRPREEKIFESEKILVPYRSKQNIFGYTNLALYSSRDVFFITERDNVISLTYCLALLNSRLYYIWLYHRGKIKGETLELYQKPLSEIPIKKITASGQKPFIEIVDKILEITKSEDYLKNMKKRSEVKDYEKEIDRMVYKLYGLTPEEKEIVDNFWDEKELN